MTADSGSLRARSAFPSRLGEFEILGVLGEGGSAIVYEARNSDREIVALKVFRNEVVATDRDRGRFLEEASKLKRVAHPGLVPLLSSGSLPDGRPYLCMPSLVGETLASRVARGPLSIETALRHFEVLCSAIAAVHDAGLIHRDIKPENVLLDRVLDAPVLLDLGIARDLDAPTSTTTNDGVTHGTPAYMAPERFFGDKANVATDIYELAVVLYSMLTGALPWGTQQDAGSRLHPRSPRELAPKISAELDALVLQALSTRPEVRPRSASEFAQRAIDACRMGQEPARTTAKVVHQAPKHRGAQVAGPIDHQTTPTQLAAHGSAVSVRGSRRGTLARVAGAAIALAGAFGVARWASRPAAQSSYVSSGARRDEQVPTVVTASASVSPLAAATGSASAEASPVVAPSTRGVVNRGASPAPSRPSGLRGSPSSGSTSSSAPTRASASPAPMLSATPAPSVSAMATSPFDPAKLYGVRK